MEGKIRGRMKERGGKSFWYEFFFLLAVWTTRLVVVELHYTSDLTK
jgi:hypothetical protein